MNPPNRRRLDLDDDPDATRSQSPGAGDSSPRPSAGSTSQPGPEDDPRLLAAVQDYLAALEAGRRPSRGEWLARYADIADRLSAYLDGLAFVHSAAGRMLGTAPSPSGDPSASGPEVEPLAGRPLGDFKLLREIGRGGMGVVYEAEQLSLGRRVAVKVLPLAASLDSRHLQRFKNEAHAAAQLHHTNIVPVYAVGYERSVHFYAMQLIDGRSLAEVIGDLRRAAGRPPADAAPPSDAHVAARDQEQAGPSEPIIRRPPTARAEFSSAIQSVPSAPAAHPSGPPASATGASAVTAQALSTLHTAGGPAFYRAVARLGFQAADALDYAHQLGVVHRDIKPANLLLDMRGTLWVTDFGLAQMYTDPGLTQPGDLVGTLRYMSPEQATGGGTNGRAVVLDQRTDVYSLGATLYELLTLERAVPGKTREQLLHAIGYADPRPARSIDRSIPADLETIVAKATAKDPAERYATARAMADDLWRFLQSEPILARPPSVWDKAVKWARRHKPVTVSAVVILVLAAVGLLTSTVLIARAQARAQAAYTRERQRAAEANEQRAAAVEQRARADRNYQRAHEVLDQFTEFATNDLASRPDLADLRKDMLETSLAYYQDFIEDRKDDPSTSAVSSAVSVALAESRERATAILQDLTAFDDLFRVTTRSELLPQRAVREDLKLAADGGKEDGTAEFVPNSWRKLLGDRDLGRMGPAERRACLADVAARIDARLNQVLTPEQSERLRQIHRQVRGAAAFSDPDVVAALSLTRDQKSKIRAIQARSRGARRPFGPGRSPEWGRPPEDAVRDVVALLMPDQARKWMELVGPPFKGSVDANDRGPGRPGGPPGKLPLRGGQRRDG